MVEEVMDRLYRIEVPLPNSPLKELNSYVIKGDGRDLVIDTGFNRTVCYEAMREGLDALDCDPARTDFLITHMHSDHAGLVARLASGSSTVYFSRIDSRVFDKDRSWQPLVDYAEVNGFPADELMKAMQNHPGFKYKPETVPELTLIDDGFVIAIGGYRLRALGTPGHTQGHICLYDEDEADTDLGRPHPLRHHPPYRVVVVSGQFTQGLPGEPGEGVRSARGRSSFPDTGAGSAISRGGSTR